MASASVASTSASTMDDKERYAHIDTVLQRPGPSTDTDNYLGGTGATTFLRNSCKILVIGAGGLGCEILVTLSLLGFSSIHVIDMDTIDVSNLNRQFLFRPTDVGQPKSTVAAKFVNERVPGAGVVAHFGKIQDFDDEFYLGFNIVVCGLDSVAARRWLNAKLVGLVDGENPESLKPLIDGGTEGFKGSSRVILPTITACIECTLTLYTPQIAFPICTIATTPRIPEHCITWASVLEWPRLFPDKKIDGDDPDHIAWLFDTARRRAEEFGIEGVSWSMTQGVVKNIIPAIPSTNAVIAASLCNEAFKIATSTAPYMDNYMLYIGTNGIYTHTFSCTSEPTCPICGAQLLSLTVSRSLTLSSFLELLHETPSLQLSAPSISLQTDDGTLEPVFFQGKTPLALSTAGNLDRKVGELWNSGDSLAVTAGGLDVTMTIKVDFEGEAEA